MVYKYFDSIKMFMIFVVDQKYMKETRRPTVSVLCEAINFHPIHSSWFLKKNSLRSL